jgi:hypothetical protein
LLLQLDPALLDQLLLLLEGDDVDLTEEVTTLLLAFGRTPRGLDALLGPRVLRRLLEGVVDGEPAHRPLVVDEQPDVIDTPAFTGPFRELLEKQKAHGAKDDEPQINSVILLRVLTLLTHIACGTRPSSQPGADAASSVAGGSASAAASATAGSSTSASASPPPVAAASPAPSVDLRARGWSLFESRGLWALVLSLASLGESGSAHVDLLVQLNALGLVEEIVAHCPRMDDSFATNLVAQLLQPITRTIEQRAREGAGAQAAAAAAASSGAESAPLIPTSSFISVALLRVLNKLAVVSAASESATGQSAAVSVSPLRSWYRTREALVFLSAAAQSYDDEGVQAEALDLLASMATFAEGLAFFSSTVSALPVAAQSAPATAAAYTSEHYAAAGSPVLLLQLPFFVSGSNYASGLRQLAALHGLARVLSTKYPDPDPAEEAQVAGTNGGAAAASSAAVIAKASPVPSAPSLQLRRLFCMLSMYNPGRAPLEPLLTLARQPFEDVREAVWSVLLSLTGHRWGVGALVGSAGFVEFLLDRRTEFHTAGWTAKFRVVRALDSSPHAQAMLTQQQRALLHEYVRQGAHYAPRAVGVLAAPVSQFK